MLRLYWPLRTSPARGIGVVALTCGGLFLIGLLGTGLWISALAGGLLVGIPFGLLFHRRIERDKLYEHAPKLDLEIKPVLVARAGLIVVVLLVLFTEGTTQDVMAWISSAYAIAYLLGEYFRRRRQEES